MMKFGIEIEALVDCGLKPSLAEQDIRHPRDTIKNARACCHPLTKRPP